MFVNLMAPINQLGYGVVGFNVLKHLALNGHSVSYFPIGKPEWENRPSDVEAIQKSAENAKFFMSEAPSIKIWHQNEMSTFPVGGERIGWPIFELDKFTELELHHLESLDKIFVCSEWAKKVCLDNGLESVHVVPLGVDRTIYYPDEDARKRRPWWTAKKTVFLNVGKWEKRKGHEELLEAFNKAFTPEDNVELWMLNDNPFIGIENERWKLKYLSTPMGQKIKHKTRIESQDLMRELYNHVDFGVFPAHAEGWNLEPLELMACGVPSIVTNYSGHSEYCDEKNALLIEPNGSEPANDGKWFHGQGSWCTFSVDDLVKQMRTAHEMKQGGEEVCSDYGRLCASAIQAAKKFSWFNTVEAIEAAL